MPVNTYLTITPPPASLTPDLDAERWLQDLVNLLSAAGGLNPTLIDPSAIDHNAMQNVNRLAGATANLHIDQPLWDGVTTAVGQLQADLVAANTQALGLQAQITGNDTDITALQTTITALTTRVAALETTIADHEARLVAGGL